jgi:hypothetical protein
MGGELGGAVAGQRAELEAVPVLTRGVVVGVPVVTGRSWSLGSRVFDGQRRGTCPLR